MKRSKYKAVPHIVDGKRFDSRKEAARYSMLTLLQTNGYIRNLTTQVPIMLEGKRGPLKTRKGRQMRLTVDFVYWEHDAGEWRIVHEDVKGMPTRDYEVRKAVAEAMGYTIRET